MKTESNIRPASQFEIEALPPIEGRSCAVILYDNIQGPFTRQASGISIHAPARGATCGGEVIDYGFVISIHAPARGATAK